MSFQQGLSGLNAASKQLEVIGNNVANANTVGFKSASAVFADIYAASLSGASSTQAGLGTKVGAIKQQYTQGTITATSDPLDLAINGKGFFRVVSNGAAMYTRNGQFQLDKGGNIVNANGDQLTGFMADANGTLRTGSPTVLNINQSDISPAQTSRIDGMLNLDSRSPTLTLAGFDPNDPASYNHSTSTTIYDSLGNEHTLQSYFVKTSPGVWDVMATVDGSPAGYTPPAAPVAVGTMTFKPDGSLDTTATSFPFTVPVSVASGATTPFNVALTLSGTSQFGSNFGVNAMTQDGYTSGRLSGFSIGSDGLITGRYTNGKAGVLGQVVMANFNNPNGLSPLGDNNYAETASSGTPLVGTPGSGAFGVIQSSAIEESNVDLTSELVSMITAQRNYQANAQTIKTQDQVLQTLVNLR